MPAMLPEELEEEMACDKFATTHKDIIETTHRKYSYNNNMRRQQNIVLSQHRNGRKTPMSPLAGACGD